MTGSDSEPPTPVTGRCYCGATTFRSLSPPLTVAYCHCADCRRWTGGPVAAFAAFSEADVMFMPDEGRRISPNPGAVRSFCPSCGSPIAARFAYIPGQVYVAVGLIDQAERFAPAVHAHVGEQLSWLHIADDLERFEASSRSRLREASD